MDTPVNHRGLNSRLIGENAAALAETTVRSPLPENQNRGDGRRLLSIARDVMNRDRKVIQVSVYDGPDGVSADRRDQSTAAPEKGKCHGRIGSRATS
jgi:hypothetical protein